ncbi:MAG: MoaD/ThiS family protein [Promethearchaeati archaeon]
MNVRVKIFGNLKKKLDLKDDGAGIPTIINIEFENDSAIIKDLFDKLSLDIEETSHIFVNGDYAGLKRKIREGDTIAIFPRDMALLYKWYFNREGDIERREY